MRRTEVLVIGGGLSGTRVAERLHARGTDVVLVDARDRLGGRILSLGAGAGAGVDASAVSTSDPHMEADDTLDPGPRVELGPSWFWPGQAHLHALVAELGLETAVFEQASDGLSIAEHADGRIERARGLASMHGSLRIAGGLQRLVDGLARGLPDDDVLLGTRALGVVRTDGGALTRLERTEIVSRHVVLALPPRLVTGRIAFEPALPDAWHAWLRAVPTWMAGQAKLVAVYATPFWRESGLSGDAVSQRGPLGEIHDASSADGSLHALFGFVGVTAAARTGHDAALEQAAVAQLARLFGEPATRPVRVHYKDWATDPFTATDADGQGRAHADGAALPDGPWGETLQFAGAETASTGTGYLEGALVSAERVCAAIAGAR